MLEPGDGAKSIREMSSDFANDHQGQRRAMSVQQTQAGYKTAVDAVQPKTSKTPCHRGGVHISIAGESCLRQDRQHEAPPPATSAAPRAAATKRPSVRHAAAPSPE